MAAVPSVLSDKFAHHQFGDSRLYTGDAALALGTNKVAAKDYTPPSATKRMPPGPSTQGRENMPASNPPLVVDSASAALRPKGSGSGQRALHWDAPANATNKQFVGTPPHLKLKADTPSLVVNGSSPGAELMGKAGNSQTPSDDNSQRAESSSDLGTKPPSLDGKSITSGTTFALDEKESLRPDDSASVKAAAEDDDAFSVRGSNMANSRMGSDLAARIHRIQIGDMPLRPLTTTNTLAGNHGLGIATPQSGDSEKQPSGESKLPLVGGAVAASESLTTNGFLSQNPDEKLLEAMQSSKDRLFLLRLEQQVIEFVQDSKEPFMDLPPSNSFCRMLMHKLADYYHMTHSFEAVQGAVRIFRTPFCRIPPSLSSISINASTSSSPAPAVLPRKIMRRGEDEFGSGSAGASKATSEDGGDSKDKAPNHKLTREEREEAYNRARQRIFGSVEKTEGSTPEGEDGNGMSRASSVSAKDRSNMAKRKTHKQRRDDSESFDSRSQYVVMSNGPQQSWAPAAPQYYAAPAAASYNGQYQQPYAPGVAVAPGYGPNQGYGQMMPNSGYPPPYNGMVPVQPVPPSGPPQPQRYPPHNPSMPGPYGPPVMNGLQQVPNGLPQPNIPPSNMPPHAWPQQAVHQPPLQPVHPPVRQPVHQAPIHPPAHQPPVNQAPPAPVPVQQPFNNQSPYPSTRGSPAPGGIPYLYGQLPVNVNPNDPKSQHPIPGSYSRQSFNPKSQTFVPGGGGPPSNTFSGGGPGSHHSSPQFNSLHMNYPGVGYPQPPPPQPMYGPGSYGMARQSSNNSMTQYHPPLGMHGPPPMGPNVAASSPHLPNKPMGMPAGPGPVPGYGHLPHYGNPATLPQKPATQL
ncbi:hypothetical protein QBC39DRAFT_109973 [Podospora conica]|nr:hypothetical protein QBC39DRAFT_109973 [Schizothecium conicum]